MEGTGPVDWLPALAFLAAGLAVGALLVWRIRSSRRPAPPAAVPPLEVRDLQGRRDALVQQLRELEDTAAKRTPRQLATERYTLELETARVLMQLDARGAPTPSAAPAARAAGTATRFLETRPALRGFFWGTAGTAVLGLLLFFVSQSARPRVDGGPATGNAPGGGVMGSSTASPSPDAQEKELKAALAKSPDDVEARLALTRVYLARQDMMAVWNETQTILAKSPNEPRALSYQSLVRLAMGQADVALEMLKRAIKADPDQIESYIHLSLVYSRMGRTQDSDAAIDEALRRFPDQAAMLRQVQQQIHSAATERPAATAEANPHAAVAPPGGAAEANPHAAIVPAEGAGEPPLAAPAPAAAPPGAGRVAGVVDLDPSLQGRLPSGTVVFVMLREAGFGAGPPIAAKRLPASSFPIPFEITDADSMRGDPLPKEVLLEARADADGDPMTRSPEDPVARLDDVKTGTTSVRLVLKRR
jgi:cytochrome c-type biogenesis protein CcmH